MDTDKGINPVELKSLKNTRVLIIVENLPVPMDRRVWQEANSLHGAGCQVSVICPAIKGFKRGYELIDGIHVYRHPLPVEGRGSIGYLVEYSASLSWQFVLALRVFFSKGFDVIHACNPPDTIFVIGAFFKLFGKKFVFDHHDINPELYLAKFGRRDVFYKLLLLLERLTFWTADISIATNHSYKQIAIERGGMAPSKVFVVRSGPDEKKYGGACVSTDHDAKTKYVAGYVGVMGSQDGIDALLRIARIIVYDFNRRDIHFKLIGDGTELKDMVALAKEMGLSDFVTFTGYLNGRELIDAIASIDVGLAPDKYNSYNDKCTMNKVMEYMAAGKPVVQFDLKEGRYSASDSALYASDNNEIDFARKVITLIDDDRLRKTMGKKGCERIKNKLSWRHEEKELLNAYIQLVKAFR